MFYKDTIHDDYYALAIVYILHVSKHCIVLKFYISKNIRKECSVVPQMIYHFFQLRIYFNLLHFYSISFIKI